MSKSQNQQPGGTDKRKGRKGRKQNEKEFLYEHTDELNTIKSERLLYENMHHLSEKEHENFEDKFTRPKNRSQEIYTSILRSKTKKSFLQRVRQEPEKHCLPQNMAFEISCADIAKNSYSPAPLFLWMKIWDTYPEL